jgi:hypothetical protein
MRRGVGLLIGLLSVIEAGARDSATETVEDGIFGSGNVESNSDFCIVRP